jgi:acetate kinase
MTVEGASRDAAPQIVEWADESAGDASIIAIGHRLVHGGERVEPCLLTPVVLTELDRLVPFAPNHLPAALSLIRACAAARPAIPQIGCFDTAFHSTLPPVARRLPIPAALDARGVRRYGFHGLSYTYVVEALGERLAPAPLPERLVLAHLGNGASLAAVRSGRSVDTTMGFTPLGGIVMSTRSGDLDPGVVSYLAREQRLSGDDLERELGTRAGLLGVSGVSGDMRVLLEREADDPNCALALEMFVVSAAKAIAALSVSLGGLEAVAFSGGIGEHAAPIRARVCALLAFAGIRLDEAANARHTTVISNPQSSVRVFVIPTDEELVIARAAHRLLQKG